LLDDNLHLALKKRSKLVDASFFISSDGDDNDNNDAADNNNYNMPTYFDYKYPVR
jgi:hypothetical protein